MSPPETRWWTWLVAGAVAGPFGTLLHELGHYMAAKTFGLSGVRLHISSVSFAGDTVVDTLLQSGHRAEAAQLVALWKVAWVAAAGPIISLTFLGLAVLCRKRWPAAAVATGLAFGWRFVAPAGVLGVMLLRAVVGNHAPLSSNVDEINAARAWDASPALIMLPVVLLVSYALGVLIVATPKRSLLAVCAGLVLSLTLYFTIVP